MPSISDSAGGTLYLYVDESGNFDFGRSGTRHFLLCGVLMRRPFTHLPCLLDVKYDFLEQGLDLEHFHAFEDRQAVRDGVFRCLAAHVGGMRVVCVVARKAALDSGLQTPEGLYSAAFDLLIRETLDARAPAPCAQIIAITDSLPVHSGGAAVRKAVRTTLRAWSPAGATYRIPHHASRADVNLQVSDYCAWAAHRTWEHADDRSYRIMADAGVAWVEARLVHAG